MTDAEQLADLTEAIRDLVTELRAERTRRPRRRGPVAPKRPVGDAAKSEAARRLARAGVYVGR